MTAVYMKVEKRRQLQSERLLTVGEGGSFALRLPSILLLRFSVVDSVGFGRISSIEVFRIPRLTDLSTKTGWGPDRSPSVL